MKSLRILLGAWTWRGTTLVVLSAPAGAALALVVRARGGSVASAVLAAALLVTGLSAVLLRRAVAARDRALGAVQEELDRLELGQRADRARLHEIDATVAGIASAQQLLSAGIAAERYDALAAMVQAEVQRLQRLLAERAPERRRAVDLDDVVGQIVLAHVARGRRVTWEPSGLRALARGDDVAEVVNVLLENAAVHGGPGRVRVRVAPDATGAGVSVTVSDQGPGVPPELRERLFDWGVSRPGSPGQGIGLHAAAELAHQMGGRLELRPGVRGATFALHLPAAPVEVSRREHVAQAS
ncbi:HAMP domain-containing histidine kinase [Nocardioides anomalus]|uniref:histidine kinase n=1 Tax=Nocardioides anomalus TaxID=2712223 RepID=A0A6G6WH74_9ACTN|nr:HAMP domain-containing sensor histidine kinase [Nocardioides anomalus]QIG44410.1 HAMP domain-containing histidine kinase [Nocardioides anomalus]